jgi:hypothetical protein
MKVIPKVIHRTAEEIEEVIKEREAEAALLPPGTVKQTVLVEVARLRSYAEMKRLLALPG